MLKRLTLLMLSGMILTFVITSFIPVPMQPEKHLEVVSGTVDRIFEAGQFDIVFRLKENGKCYYINRGVEQGLSIDRLKEELLHQEVIIKYPKYWRFLQSNDTKHLSKLIFKDMVIYTELPTDLVARN